MNVAAGRAWPRAAGLFVALLISFGNRAWALDLPEPASGYVRKTSPLKMGFYRIT